MSTYCGYTKSEIRKNEAAYRRLSKELMSPLTSAAKFGEKLRAEMDAGFPVDWRWNTLWKDVTLLHRAAYTESAVENGLVQVLIAAGADVNLATGAGRTAFGFVCESAVLYGGEAWFGAAQALLDAGADAEADTAWRLTSERVRQTAERLEGISKKRA